MIIFFTVILFFFTGFVIGTFFQKAREIKRIEKQKKKDQHAIQKKLWDSYLENIH